MQFRRFCFFPIATFLTISLAATFAQEKFEGTERVRPKEAPRQLAPTAKLVKLKVGEIREMLSASTRLFTTKDEKAFYVPPEGNAVLQVVIEAKSGKKTYFVKALAAGETIGGVVDRDMLDEKGYRPKNDAEHARIQRALKEAPTVFVIE